MEKTANMTLTNADYLRESLQCIKNSVKSHIDKITDTSQQLEKITSSIIKPINTIKKIFIKDIAMFKKRYDDFMLNMANNDTFIQEFLLKNESTSMNDLSAALKINTDILNDDYIIEEVLENVASTLSHFDNLYESKEFGNVVHLLNTMKDHQRLPEREPDETESIDDYSSLGERKMIMKRNKLIGNKTKREHKKKVKVGVQKKNKDTTACAVVSNAKKSIDINSDSVSKSSSASVKNKKRITDATLLEMLRKSYPCSNYVSKLSKTFLRRRLFKKIIYIHKFNYTLNDSAYEDEKIKSSGETTKYKYAKITFSFISKANPQIDFNSPLICEMITHFKSNFIEKRGSDLIISGKILTNLAELLENVFRGSRLKKQYSVQSAVIEFYEFYEELSSEFDISDYNIKANFDDKTLSRLYDDWKMLRIVREFVENAKNKVK